MNEVSLRIGTGNAPKGFEHFLNVQSVDKFIGIKGRVHIHLHGEWETLVTPGKLRMVLSNLSHNRQLPTVTLSL